MSLSLVSESSSLLPMPGKALSFSLPNGLACSLSYVKAKDGAVLAAGDLEKLPSYQLLKLIQSATLMFSEKNAAQLLAGAKQVKEVHFSITEGNAQESYLQEVAKADGYAKKSGIGPYEYAGRSTRQSPFTEQPQKTLFQPAEAGFDVLGNSQAAMDFTCDGLSLTRNALRSIPSFGPGHPMVSSLAAFMKPLIAASGGISLYSACGSYADSQKMDDAEGRREALKKGVTASTFILATACWGASTISDGINPSSALSSFLGNATSTFFAAGSVLGMAISGGNVARCVDFRDNIDSFYLNEKLSPKQRMQGTLEFFREQIWLTEQEERAIFSSVQKVAAGLSQGEIQRKMEAEAATSVEKKIAIFKRRAGNKSLREIVKNLDEIQRKLNNPLFQDEGMEEAKRLVQLVKGENRKRTTLYALSFLGALLSFKGELLMAFASLPLPFIVGGLAAAISLFLGVYAAYHFFKGKSTPELTQLNAKVLISYTKNFLTGFYLTKAV